MEQTLNGLGIVYCRDVKHRLMHLYLNFSENFFEYITKASMGMAKIEHDPLDTQDKKSLCIMKSFRLITRFDQFKSKISELASKLAKKADEESLMGRTIGIEFQADDYSKK